MIATLAQTVLILGLLGFLIHKTSRLRQEIGKLRSNQKALAEKTRRAIDERLWSQIESMLAIYRLLDGKLDLPRTRLSAASPDLIVHLIRLVRANAPRTIVECGSGVSTIAFAAALRALGQSGHVYSVENSADYSERIRTELALRGLEDRVTFIVAPLVEKTYAGLTQSTRWYALDPGSIPAAIDLLFIDGPQGSLQPLSRYPAGPELLQRLAPGGVAILDDTNRPDEAAMPKMWKKMFPSLIVRKLRAEKGAYELRMPTGPEDKPPPPIEPPQEFRLA